MGVFDFLKEIPLSAVLKEKLNDVEREVQTLREANKSLENLLSERERRIAQLQQQLKAKVEAKLDEKAVCLLQALAAYPPGTEAKEPDLAEACGMGVQVVSYHLTRLAQSKHVEAHNYAGMSSFDIAAETHWTLEFKGREYLIQQGLLQ